MFPSFIGILDIQSWWEVPSIAHFCSLFRAAFNLLDFDIEELEEALLTDGTEECASSLLTELIVRLLCGCLGNNDISAFNYQMFLRRLFRQKCQETSRYNPFNTDIDFQFLPLRTKVEILYALCDFRLDAEDVFDLFRNLEAESLRVEPLGWDDHSSAYWYFYGTRLYREDYKVKTKGRKRKSKEEKKRKKRCDVTGVEEDSDRVWQVVCFTEADWTHLTEKFKAATSRIEKELYSSLSENFLPEIPRLFQEKERLQRKRLLESVPRRTSSRVQTKNKQKEEEDQKQQEEILREKHEEECKEKQLKGESDNSGREGRAKRREKIRSQPETSASEVSRSPSPTMSPKHKKRGVKSRLRCGQVEPAPVMRPSGRQTNNSLACATGQILIPDIQEAPDTTRKKLKTSQVFALSEEDVQTDMYKVLEQLKSHEDAWPFMDPVEEEYAPNYYSVIRRPMDLQRMEERLDQGYYTDLSMFKSDFNLIVNNCRLYNGQDNEYTEMVDNLEVAFNKLSQRYFDRLTSSDDEIAVEYPPTNPSPRKHKPEKRTKQDHVESKKRKRKSSQSQDGKTDEETKSTRKHKNKRSRSNSHNEAKKMKRSTKTDNNDSDIDSNAVRQSRSRSRDTSQDRIPPDASKDMLKDTSKDTPKDTSKDTSKDASKEKSKDKSRDKSRDKLRTKSKGTKSGSSKKKKKSKGLKSSKKSRKDKHLSKKNRQKKKHSKRTGERVKKKRSRKLSGNSYEKSDGSEPKVHVPKKRAETPEIDFFKDKYDKIKERRRGNHFDSATDKSKDKLKSNLSLPEKDKNLKLKETIEKLKAKSEKSSDNSSMFEDIFGSNSQQKEGDENDDTDSRKNQSEKMSKATDEYEFVDDLGESSCPSSKCSSSQNKSSFKKPSKKQVSTKNESATEALEQAVKDISKWLDDTPKLSDSSNSNSPLQVNSDEYLSIPAKLEDDIMGSNDRERGFLLRKDAMKKRLSNKDLTKVLSRRKEVQRTIERLQPGKSKGNLISNIQSSTKQEDVSIPSSAICKSKEVKNSLIVRTDEGSPKLSLGTVLPSVGFGLGKQHNFTNENNPNNVVKVEVVDTGTMTCEVEEIPVNDKPTVPPVVEPVEVPVVVAEVAKPARTLSQCQEKATPNLSAWFKAFGAPKSGAPPKKKPDDVDHEDCKSSSNDTVQMDAKNTSPVDSIKNEQISVDEALTTEGEEGSIPHIVSTIRTRRTSTGSSISERSSFSQDLDSPRHQPSHSSPLLTSPASPRNEEQKTYPLMNVTVRVGFYQDTASVKSSPEKSCSPRDAPQSPFAGYSQHVYAAASSAANSSGQTTHTYSEGPSKSPLPTYGQTQPPPYYDTTKANQGNKVIRAQEDYTAFGPDSVYQQPTSPFAGPFSPVHSPYSHHSQHSPYSHVQNSPQTFPQPTAVNNVTIPVDRPTEKSSIFPVKKRMYSESCQHTSASPDTTSSALLTQPIPSIEQTVKTSDKSDIPLATGSLMFESNKIVPANSADVCHSNATSVIMTTDANNVHKIMQYPTCPKNVPNQETNIQSKSQESQQSPDNKLHHVRPPKSQFIDVPAVEYPLQKIQYDFSSSGLGKSYIDGNFISSQNISKHSFNSRDLKSGPFMTSTELSARNLAEDMVNMGYSNKGKPSNVDMVNMGYLMPDSMTTESKLARLNACKMETNSNLIKYHRGFDIYNMGNNIPFVESTDPNIAQSISKPAHGNESQEFNQRYGYEKISPTLYQNSSVEVNKVASNILHPENLNIPRPSTTKPNYPAVKDNTIKNINMPSYDWKIESTKKNVDPHNFTSLQKEMQSKLNSKSSIPEENTSSTSNVNNKLSNVALANLYESSNINESDQSLQRPELRIPILRAVIEISSSVKPDSQPTQSEYASRSRNVNLSMPLHVNKTVDNSMSHNIPLTTGSNMYKPTHVIPSLSIDPPLRTLSSIPQIMDRYAKDDRVLSSFQSDSTVYHDKPLSHYPKNVHSGHHSGVSSAQMYVPATYGRGTPYTTNIQTPSHNLTGVDYHVPEAEKKPRSRKKKSTTDSTPVSGIAQSYMPYPALKTGQPTTSEPSAISLKSTNIVPGSAFNFGPPGSVGLSSGLYSDSSSFFEELRNSPANQYMTANYMAVAAAAHQRNTPDTNDKSAKPAHQASSHATSNPFQFLGHPQVRPGYPLMGMDPSSTLYQQYLQRHQEDLLRHSGMGIFPPGYPSTLGVNRPSWL